MECLKLLFGTGNPAKFSGMKKRLEGLPIELISLREMDKVPDIQEEGKDPRENARMKAEAYWTAYHIPVFSCDSGLFIKELPQELQPGVHVRRQGGHSMSDEEMTAYYAGLARAYGRLTARYQNAVCLILDAGHRYESMADELSGNPFWITDQPHPRTVKGYPLDRISLQIPSGAYYYDIQEKEPDGREIDRAFRHFFEQALSDWKQ